jgi:hypothetical protein
MDNEEECRGVPESQRGAKFVEQAAHGAQGCK